MKRKNPKLAILLAFAVMLLQACYCLGSPIPYIICQRSDGSTYSVSDDLWGYDNCGINGDTEIGQSYSKPTDTPPTLPLGNSGTNNIIAPTGISCNSLRLTSPVGLANGVNTFYWDAVPSAVAYRITIYDHNGTYLATFDSQGSTTNLTADVGWNTIGGQFELRVEITAFGGGSSCSRTFNILREAPSNGNVANNNGGGGGQAASAPTNTPVVSGCQDPNPNNCIK